MGAGAALTAAVTKLVSLLPGSQKPVTKLESLLQPKPAFVYGIPHECNVRKFAGES
jgi:hypothetical protein